MTSSRKTQRGTREVRNTLWTVEELMLPRPARMAISRIDGRPAAECSWSRRSKRSLIGPGGAGSRLIATTLDHPSQGSNYVHNRHVLHTAERRETSCPGNLRSAGVMQRCPRQSSLVHSALLSVRAGHAEDEGTSLQAYEEQS